MALIEQLAYSEGHDLDSRCELGKLEINGILTDHVITSDFPLTDPWSNLAFRPALIELVDQGWLDDQLAMEIGTGDGRNLKVSGDRIIGAIGIDSEAWRLDAAWANIRADKNLSAKKTELYNCDGVEFLTSWKKEKLPPFNGRIMMCLPQSYGGDSTADVIRPHPLHRPYRRWKKWGLDLNAAVLGELRTMVTPETEALVILNDRIPPDIREQMIDDMGWQVRDLKRVTVQQDPDTKLEWMLNLPLGRNRFRTKDGWQLSAAEAVERINRAREKRENLDLYHDVYVYVLKPNPDREFHAARYSRERPTLARTTEPKALPLFYLPHPKELEKFNRIDVLSVTGAGQILDWLAFEEMVQPGKIRKVDFIDISPGQNLFIAYILAHLPDFDNGEALLTHLRSSKPEDIRRDWDMVFERFPELRRYITKEEDKVIDWEYLTNFLTLDEDNTVGNLCHYFFRHQGMYDGLKRLVEHTGTIRFHEESLEEFAHPDKSYYQVLFSSDIHPQTNKDELLQAYARLIRYGGFGLMTSTGNERVMYDDHVFLKAMVETGNFNLLQSPEDLNYRRFATVFEELGLSWQQGEDFLQSGMYHTIPDLLKKTPIRFQRRHIF